MVAHHKKKRFYYFTAVGQKHSYFCYIFNPQPFNTFCGNHIGRGLRGRANSARPRACWPSRALLVQYTDAWHLYTKVLAAVCQMKTCLLMILLCLQKCVFFNHLWVLVVQAASSLRTFFLRYFGREPGNRATTIGPNACTGAL